MSNDLRRWITLCEMAALPPKAVAAIGKIKTILLKDGRKAQLTLEQGQRDGVYIEVWIDNVHAGSANFDENLVPPAPDDPDDYDPYKADRGSWSASHVAVDPQFQRLGLATAMYDYAAQLGLKILPSGSGYGGKLLPNGASLWQSRRKPLRLGKPLPKQDRFWRPKPVKKP